MTRCQALSTGLLLAVFGCEAIEPAPDAGFIEAPERMGTHAELPFHKVWIKPGVEVRNDYRKLYVAPVNSDYLHEMGWYDKESDRYKAGEFDQDIKDLVAYTQTAMIESFREDENARFEVVSAPGDGVAVLEMALIEVVPSRAVLHAIGWLPPIGSGALISALTPRTVAFEARIRDGGSREVIATFADREKQPAGAFDVTRMTWFGPAKGIIDAWGEQFVEIVNRAPGEIIQDPIPYTLKPW